MISIATGWQFHEYVAHFRKEVEEVGCKIYGGAPTVNQITG